MIFITNSTSTAQLNSNNVNQNIDKNIFNEALLYIVTNNGIPEDFTEIPDDADIKIYLLTNIQLVDIS